LRKHGPEVVEGKEIAISGAGAWKNLTVTDVSTGEIIAEKKFYKADFGSVWKDEQYEPYIESLLEQCLVKTLRDPDSMDIDTESFEEVRALAMEADLLLDSDE